ncbi:hypothetical protein EJ110_NYTH29751 [Nymphaea thermarum]|nr:hypothetical protein EJ110_NYTH29751 [Nymphaea thermarum]
MSFMRPGSGYVIIKKTYLTDEHLDSTNEEQESPPVLVHRVNGYQCSHDVHTPSDDSGHEGGIAAKPDGLEQQRSIEHDHVNACELLEEGDGDGHDQLRPVLLLQDVSSRVFDLFRGLASVKAVLVLLLHISLINIGQCLNESRCDLPFHARLKLSSKVHCGLDSNVIESFPTFTY